MAREFFPLQQTFQPVRCSFLGLAREFATHFVSPVVVPSATSGRTNNNTAASISESKRTIGSATMLLLAGQSMVTLVPPTSTSTVKGSVLCLLLAAKASLSLSSQSPLLFPSMASFLFVSAVETWTHLPKSWVSCLAGQQA